MSVDHFEMEFPAKLRSRRTLTNNREDSKINGKDFNTTANGIFHKEFNINALDFLPQENGDFQHKRNEFLDVLLKISIALMLICLMVFAMPLICSNSDTTSLQDVKAEIETTKFEAQTMINEELIRLKEEIITIVKKLKDEYKQQCNMQIKEMNELIANALDLYDADKTGLMDYALESNGASILSIPETTPYSPEDNKFMAFFSLGKSSNPRILLQPRISPGECFAFRGQTGRIIIHLFHEVYITSFTIEHAHKSLVEDITTAPKEFAVFGLDNETKEIVEVLGQFTYNLDKCLETFNATGTIPRRKYQYVELRILSNHGSPTFTCVYRFRIHGHK